MLLLSEVRGQASHFQWPWPFWVNSQAERGAGWLKQKDVRAWLQREGVPDYSLFCQALATFVAAIAALLCDHKTNHSGALWELQGAVRGS